MSPRNIGVVVTTYNQPAWLHKVLIGYEQQTCPDFRVLIADDGSDERTLNVIDDARRRGKLAIDHIAQPDEGFRKCRVLNRAIAQTDCDYLIFTDGDCIPAPDFVAVHRRCAQQGVFLSGGYIKLPMALSQRIDEELIRSGRVFDRRWLIDQGVRRSSKLWKLIRSPWIKELLNRLTPARASWNGMNSSTWTRDIIAVNGFNEDMKYGGLDREFGERLCHYGMSPRQIRYSAATLHLDHERGYAAPEIWQRNKAIRAEVKRFKRHWTPNGLAQHYLEKP